ncbi:MAG: flavin reductase family protein [Oscillospiraceae bacterium]|nr:flavin reductase family protein [Oscillospiraceae bacterium]
MKKTDITKLSFDPFEKIGKEWMLVTSGNMNSFNTMTASWGFAGVMWGKNCAVTVIRHSRYTYEFMEKNEYFTLAFFDEKYRKALNVCGSISGRDTDKVKQADLTPVEIDGNVSFKEASLVLVCRKLYAQDMDVQNIIPEHRKWYDNDAVHKQYIGEIVSAYVKE